MKLPSKRTEIPRAHKFAEQINKTVSLSDEQFNYIQLALSEAVTNAIVHGNQEDESKQVELRAWEQNGDIYISVKDEGEGFDPEAIPDPLKDHNLLKEGGRGVFLMRQYADEVEFTDGGSKVILKFSRN